ncbi:MAG TPA: AMIN domain-containing protein [Gemmatimonadales bacterium]|nr:AMIN domain-containing protein [Gemmatimonadales bacterium]
MKRFTRLLLAAAAVLGSASPAFAAGAAESGEVTGVSVRPSPGRAEVVVNVHGAVQVRDFMLRNPDRLVLDVVGAKLGANGALYDGVNRGGVVNLRYSQFRPDVVRIVLDLDGVKSYKLERGADELRVTFDTDKNFASWSSANSEAPAYAEAAPDAVAPRPAARVREPEVRVQSAGVRPVGMGLRDQPRITVTWDRASIADVVAGFAAFSGRTIILGKDIKGEVSAEIKNQPWDQAFQAILATQGLSATEMAGGIIRVDAPAALAALDSLEPLESRTVPINYTPLGQITKSVETLLTKGRGRVVADSASSSLIVTDTRSRIDEITRFVGNLDRKTPQILIKAKIIFVDRTDLERLGLRYDLSSPKQAFTSLIPRTTPAGSNSFLGPAGELNGTGGGFVDLGGSAIAGIANANGRVDNAALGLVFSTLVGGNTLTAFLSALQQQSLADIQAEPTISTLDNRKADILVGEETPIPGAPPAQGSAVAVQQVQFKETGIRLTVTPHLTNSGQILMSLRTERSAVQNLSVSQLGFNFTKQTTENQLLVNDGETAVIGGLTITEVNRTRSGIPLLSALPVVGGLFSTTETSERRRDLMILVTPRVVDDGSTGQ